MRFFWTGFLSISFLLPSPTLLCADTAVSQLAPYFQTPTAVMIPEIESLSQAERILNANPQLHRRQNIDLLSTLPLSQLSKESEPLSRVINAEHLEKLADGLLQTLRGIGNSGKDKVLIITDRDADGLAAAQIMKRLLVALKIVPEKAIKIHTVYENIPDTWLNKPEEFEKLLRKNHPVDQFMGKDSKKVFPIFLDVFFGFWFPSLQGLAIDHHLPAPKLEIKALFETAGKNRTLIAPFFEPELFTKAVSDPEKEFTTTVLTSLLAYYILERENLSIPNSPFNEVLLEGAILGDRAHRYWVLNHGDSAQKMGALITSSPEAAAWLISDHAASLDFENLKRAITIYYNSLYKKSKRLIHSKKYCFSENGSTGHFIVVPGDSYKPNQDPRKTARDKKTTWTLTPEEKENIRKSLDVRQPPLRTFSKRPLGAYVLSTEENHRNKNARRILGFGTAAELPRKNGETNKRLEISLRYNGGKNLSLGKTVRLFYFKQEGLFNAPTVLHDFISFWASKGIILKHVDGGGHDHLALLRLKYTIVNKEAEKLEAEFRTAFFQHFVDTTLEQTPLETTASTSGLFGRAA